MRVLTVLLCPPIPAETGLHLRQLAIMRLVRELGCDSHVLVFTTADRPKIHEGVLKLCDRIHEAGPRVEYSSMSPLHRARLRGSMLGPALLGRPSAEYPFSISYDEAGAGQRIWEAADEIGADTVILPTSLIHHAPRLAAKGVIVIGDAPDVVSQFTRRMLAFERPAPWRLPGLLINHLAIRSQERLFLGTCTELWATTTAEADVLRQLAPHVNVLVAGNTLDEQLYQPSDIPTEGPNGFIGDYSLAPNLDAACFLAEEVLPLIQQRRPETRVSLAGIGIPADIAHRLQGSAGVELLGHVDDSLAFVRSCRVMALTIRVRGGLPLKLVEAMACGRPVVATDDLVHGLPLVDGEDVLVGDGPDTIAAALLRVLDDPDLARSLAENGRRRFESEFSFTSSLQCVRQHSVLTTNRR